MSDFVRCALCGNYYFAADMEQFLGGGDARLTPPQSYMRVACASRVLMRAGVSERIQKYLLGSTLRGVCSVRRASVIYRRSFFRI